MSARAFFAVLLFLALAIAPLGMPASNAFAAAPSDHFMQMASTGHCDGKPVEKSGKVSDNSCCVATCIAIPAPPQPSIELQQFAEVAARPAPPTIHRGIVTELPTPPPRGA